MPTLEIATAAGSRLLAHILSGLYDSARGSVQEQLSKWSSSAEAKSIAKTLSSIERVKTLWSQDRDVSIHDFYYPPKILEGGRAKPIQSLDDLPAGNLTIQGIVGQGKSMFMRYIASSAIRSPTKPTLPIFLELRTITVDLPLESALLQILQSIGAIATPESLHYLLGSGRVVLFLDGFDEVEEASLSKLVSSIEAILLRHPNLRIITSSRPFGEAQKIGSFHTYSLAPLNYYDYKPFLERLRLDPVRREEILHALKNAPDFIEGVIRTPLMMTLLVLVYESERRIPETLPEFFERLFQVVFSRHDRLKTKFKRRLYSNLSEREIQLLFEAFCFMVKQLGYTRTLNNEQFAEAFEYAAKYTDVPKCNVDAFRKDIVTVACLMLEEGVDLTTFLHNSILEYYSASFIRHSPDSVARRFYTYCSKNYRPWSSIAEFLREIDSFRCAKYFLLEETAANKVRLSVLIDRHRRSELLAFIEEEQPGYSARFFINSQERGRRVRPSDFGPITAPSTPALTNLPQRLTAAIRVTLPQSLSPRGLEVFTNDAQYGRTLVASADEIRVTFDSIIRVYGDKEFWLQLAILRDDLGREAQRLKDVISVQEQRKLLFGDEAQ